MDVIMWYDIDKNPTADERRGPNSWYPMNPQHPDVCTDTSRGLGFRSSTPLLGLYDISNKETSKQHLYWISALGANVVAPDLTNYLHGLISDDYTNGVYNNIEVMLQNITEINESGEFPAPQLYTTLRLFGGADDSKESLESSANALRLVVDEMYGLYEKYSDAWYKFDDGTAAANRPFLVIFADQSFLRLWQTEDIHFQDDRFNIRWSNGYIGGCSTSNPDGTRFVDSPNWLFVQNEKADKVGDYITYYVKDAKGDVEQMIGWASLYLGGEDGTEWDELNNKIGGKTTFERTIRDVARLKPKVLTVCRFNSPKAWAQEPQEGISLYGSTHIEPNVDFRFLVFDNIAQNLYALNAWKKNVPSNPKASSLSPIFEGQSVKLSLKEFPLEYRISYTRNLDNVEWEYYDVNKGVSLPPSLASESSVYIQVRNSFGVSKVIKVDRK